MAQHANYAVNDLEAVTLPMSVPEANREELFLRGHRCGDDGRPIPVDQASTHRSIWRVSLGSLVILQLLAAVGPTPLSAQPDTAEAVISGTVVDPGGHPIEGVEVRLAGSVRGVFTPQDGRFRIAPVGHPPFVLQVRRPGFFPQLLSVPANWTGTVLLTQGPQQLSDVVVTAARAKPAQYAATTKYDDVFRRRRMGLGDLIDRHTIEMRGAHETAQLLEGRVGIKVNLMSSEAMGDIGGTLVSFSRCNEYPPRINVYLDGRKLQPQLSYGTASDGESILSIMGRPSTQKDLDRRRQIRTIVGEMLNRVNPSEIEMIEIFRGPADLPPEFNDGNCGAIAIWTR